MKWFNVWACKYKVNNDWRDPVNYGGSDLLIMTPLFAFSIWMWRKDFMGPWINSGVQFSFGFSEGSREQGWIQYRHGVSWKTENIWSLA